MRMFFRVGKTKQRRQKQDVKSIETSVSTKLAENVEALNQRFASSPDLIIKELQNSSGQKAALVYLENLVDKTAINDQILRPLMIENTAFDPASIPIHKTSTTRAMDQIESSIFIGKSVLLVDGQPWAIIFNTQGWPQRSIKEPQIESTLKGGHQGLVETVGLNIALIRRYLPHRELMLTKTLVGERSQTTVFLLYLRDICQPELVKELENRIDRIKIDALINAGELEEYLEDHWFTVFPQFMQTERPDTIVSQLLQGRIVLIVDNSPVALVGPMNFTSFFQNVDDYSLRWILASFLRFMRFFAFLIAISLPAFYIATISFNYEILPIDLMISIGMSRERVPFPPLLEAFIMEVTIEMIREAGVRLPSPIGQTIGVVGGIVIGQAAVQAGIVSNVMVIVVALTAISSYIIPNYDMASAIRLIRFPLMIIASMFGMVGIAIGMMILSIHIVTTTSLGYPYGSPIAPIRLPDWKDTWYRLPLWKMDKRPISADPRQSMRQGHSRKSGKN
ncbi:spore germination protein [Laceyella sediminis]